MWSYSHDALDANRVSRHPDAETGSASIQIGGSAVTAPTAPGFHPDLLEQARRYPGHALLLSGPARVGKRALALEIVAFQNCSALSGVR